MSESGINEVAKWLCKKAEYMDKNWQLYIPQAREVVKIYLDAVSE